jgi:hypothetical protein
VRLNGFLHVTDRSLFERTVAVLDKMLAVHALHFRFVRRGSLRAIIPEDQAETWLSRIGVERPIFDSVLSEIVEYINAIVFDKVQEYVSSKITLTYSILRSENKDKTEAELRERVQLVKRTIDLTDLRDRVRVRLHTPVLSYDSASWSLLEGRLVAGAEGEGGMDIGVITVNAFRPSDEGISNPLLNWWSDRPSDKLESLSFLGSEGK